jgi:hypothetical protein
MSRWFAFAVAVAFSTAALAVPYGFRYMGSRVVSQGRHVYWYWNVDAVEIGPYGNSFVARMYARNVELAEERAYAAVVRCDTKTYRRYDSKEPFEAIDDGDPVYAVWRAGCVEGRAVQRDVRYARLNAATADGGEEASVAGVAQGDARSRDQPTRAGAAAGAADKPQDTPGAGASATVASKTLPATAGAPRAPDEPKAVASAGDPRRVDQCVRLRDVIPTPFGDAEITNTCGHDVEVALCYKGGQGRAYDCPSPVRGTRAESLPPGASRRLPEYRRGSNKGIVVVACKGAIGTVFPQLDLRAGRNGCY